MAVLILFILVLVFFIKSNSRWDVKLVYGDFKRVKVGRLLSHIYVDINYNKVKDEKLCLRGLIYQIVIDVIIVLLIAGTIFIYIKTGKDKHILYYSMVIMGLSVISDLCFILPMRVKSKRLSQEKLQQYYKKKEEEERLRKAEETKLHEENTLKETFSEKSSDCDNDDSER